MSDDSESTTVKLQGLEPYIQPTTWRLVHEFVLALTKTTPWVERRPHL